jgi:hypothetical protein
VQIKNYSISSHEKFLGPFLRCIIPKLMYMSYKNCFYLTVNLLHPDGNQIINVVQENNSFCGTYMAYVNQIHRQNAFNVNIGSI